MFDFYHLPLLSLMTAYDQCTSDADKEKLLSCIRYGRLKRFVDKASGLTVVKSNVVNNSARLEALK